MSNFRYLYGPLYSWRLGMSIGVDPISSKEKICNYNCIYCQLGKTVHFRHEREVFVPTEDILEELKAFPADCMSAVTFSGRGEPTLAKNLGEMIKGTRKIRKEKIAVITNASLINHKDVQADLSLADVVLAKMDGGSQEIFEEIDQPASTDLYRLSGIIDGLKGFRRMFRGRLALQIMFVQENKFWAPQMVELVKGVGADEIQLNTPLRPCAATPLSQKEMKDIKKYFHDLPVTMVYDHEGKPFIPLDAAATQTRHGNYKMSAN